MITRITRALDYDYVDYESSGLRLHGLREPRVTTTQITGEQKCPRDRHASQKVGYRRDQHIKAHLLSSQFVEI